MSEEQPWLDEGMSEETKQYVTAYLKVIKPAQVPFMDINFIRQTRLAQAQAMNQKFKIESVKETEVMVKSKFDDHNIAVSVYTPNDCIANSPVTLFIHGGGWTLGTRVEYEQIVTNLAALTKTIWLSVEYRLGPEFKYPVPAEDCLSVFEWLATADGRQQVGATADAKIGVAGDSAGGHLSALLTHAYKGQIDFQVLIYPCVHFGKPYESYKKYTKDCYVIVPEVLDFFFTNFTTDLQLAVTPKLSPILNEDFANMPMSLTIAAEFDPLIDEGLAYHEKLLANNNSSKHVVVKGTHHGFFHQPILLKNAFEVVKTEIDDFYKSIVGSQKCSKL